MKQYATHNPDCKLIDSFDGNKKDEKELHELCKEFHHSLEWFNKDERILEIFQEYKNSNIYNEKIKDLESKFDKLNNKYKDLCEMCNKQNNLFLQMKDINKRLLDMLDRIISIQEKSNIDITDLKCRLNYIENQFQED